MIDFDIPAALAAQRDEIRAFVSDKIVPYETDPRLTRHGPDDDLRTELVGPAREAGLLTSRLPSDSAAASRRIVNRRVVRGRRLVDAGPDRAPTARTRRGQHVPHSARSPTPTR